MNISNEDRQVIAELPHHQRVALNVKIYAITQVLERQRGSKASEIRRQADLLKVSTSTVQRWVYQAQKNGPTGLIDLRTTGKPKS